MCNILVYDTTFYIRNRIKELVAKMDCTTVEVTTTQQLLASLSAPETVDLIIMDIMIPGEDGFALVKSISDMLHGIPIVILTSENKRASFVKGIQMGAADYILKPFEDDFLSSRIKEHVTKSKNRMTETREADKNIDLHQYLTRELIVAKKANYQVSLLFSIFHKNTKETSSSNEREYQRISEYLLPRLEDATFEQDLFVAYGSQSFIGVLPMCSEENRSLVDEKFIRVFSNLKLTNKALANYRLYNVFVTFPFDGETKDEIFSKLLTKTKYFMDNEKIEIVDI
ncbi:MULTISPECIES: response regulator transcription factor [unclassified Fusibacter]|uniref:response regulator transcription factor n=1 Tax=unclassified Fusibacter TaxID=2624464 RepID=UPI001013A227|nr:MULTISPECIES: response regulator [unclassified Fusibacter]MCK8059066.1 response regulator [Fusibacter sp. A2]NPE22475.1 response regulator [Fusibacter sp. A1]RXV60579.1 response regulator [Fusibacter sp. A1]